MPQPAPHGNRILQRLPEREGRRISAELERVTPPLGEVIVRAGHRPQWAYFPLTAVVSTMVVLETGATVEGATIGNEGMVGLTLLAGPLVSASQYLVQVEGEMLRVRAEPFRRMLRECEALSALLTRYALVLIERGTQNAACIQHHSIEQRMCRWLLETSSRKGRDRFSLTQEFLSEMLGVRRQSVNGTARALQRARLISYHRGQVEILNRAGLEAASCECFRVTQAAYDRAMQPPLT